MKLTKLTNICWVYIYISIYFYTYIPIYSTNNHDNPSQSHPNVIMNKSSFNYLLSDPRIIQFSPNFWTHIFLQQDSIIWDFRRICNFDDTLNIPNREFIPFTLIIQCFDILQVVWEIHWTTSVAIQGHMIYNLLLVIIR